MRKKLSVLAMSTFLAIVPAQSKELGLKVGEEYPDLNRYNLEFTDGWHRDEGWCPSEECDTENDPNIVVILKGYKLKKDHGQNTKSNKSSIVIAYTNCQGEERKIIGLAEKLPEMVYFGNGVVKKVFTKKDGEEAYRIFLESVPKCLIRNEAPTYSEKAIDPLGEETKENGLGGLIKSLMSEKNRENLNDALNKYPSFMVAPYIAKRLSH